MSRCSAAPLVFVLAYLCLAAPVLSAADCAADGTCGSSSAATDDQSSLLQSRAAVQSLGTEETEMDADDEFMGGDYSDYSEEATARRYEARVRLVIETDFMKSVQVRAYQPDESLEDNTKAAFEEFITSSGLKSELTPTEEVNYYARFKEKLEEDLKKDHYDPANPDHEVWLKDITDAAQKEAPALTEAFARSINQAGLGYQVSYEKWHQNMSKHDEEGKRGTDPSFIPDGDLVELDANLTALAQQASMPPPASFNAAQHWPRCADIINKNHNQGTCGSCWAFGALSALDSQLCIKTGGAFSGDRAMFSRGFATSCSGYSNGCGGGWPSNVYTRIFKPGDKGGVTGGPSGCVPYFGHGSGQDHFNAREGAPPCMTQCSSGYTLRTMAQDKYRFPGIVSGTLRRATNGMINSMKQKLYEQGPQCFALLADSGFSGFRSGVYRGDCSSSPNHAVTALGYGTLGGVAYIQGMNSWGSRWGQNGQFKVVECMVTHLIYLDLGNVQVGNLPSPLVPGGAAPASTAAPTTTTAAPTSTAAPTWTTPAPTTTTAAPTPDSDDEASPPPTPSNSHGWTLKDAATSACTQDVDGCVKSGNFGSNANYGNRERCEIEVSAGSPQIEVVAMNVESGYDYLRVNGRKYFDSTQLQGVVPTQNIQWSSDSSVVQSGFKICPKRSDGDEKDESNSTPRPTPASTPAPTPASTPAPTLAPTPTPTPATTTTTAPPAPTTTTTTTAPPAPTTTTTTAPPAPTPATTPAPTPGPAPTPEEPDKQDAPISEDSVRAFFRTLSRDQGFISGFTRAIRETLR